MLGWALKVGVPACGAVACVLCLRFSDTAMQNAVLAIYSVAVSLLIGDAIIVLLPPPLTHQQALWQAWQASGISGDHRTVTQVVRDLRSEGVAAYPKLNPSAELESSNGEAHSRITINGVEIVALSTIPDTISVLCNETGSYVTYTSDERGFNNPPGLWQLPKLEIAFVGDSYTEGACVPSAENMVSRVREQIPATMNLGMSGDGPLLELATLSEYLPEKTPTIVVWEYTEGNDLTDLVDEMRSPILRRYFEDGFTQGLVTKQQLLTTALTDYADSAIRDIERGDGEERSKPASAADFLLLRHLRGYAERALQPSQIEATKSENLQRFRTIAQKMRARVAAWGGKLVFVYLPSPSRYDKVSRPWMMNNDLLSIRDDILAIIRELGISMTDLDRVFRQAENPHSYYASGIGHLSNDGYRAAAEAIEVTLSSELGSRAGR